MSIKNIHSLSHHYVLDCFRQTIPFIQKLFTIDNSILITDDKRFLFYYPGKELNFGNLSGREIPADGVVEEALQTGKMITDAIPRDKYGIPFRNVSIPIRTNEGTVIGTINFGVSLKDEAYLLKAAELLECSIMNYQPLGNGGNHHPVFNKDPKSIRSYSFDSIIGSSPQIMKAITFAKKVAALDNNVLILGESGTGKEVFAQAIHNSGRPNGPFMAVNCAAIPKTLIESELFGYEGGSFTGAEKQGRPGKIELANNGTLFLDEIGDMPLDLQPALLRVLEEKKVMRVGGSKYIPVNFRLIAATNKNLLELVHQNRFREDLYYRIAVFRMFLPPLKDRGPDVIRLAKYFIHEVAAKQQIPEPLLSEAAKINILKYDWPGNIRELKNAIDYAVNMSSNGMINVEDLPEEIQRSSDLSIVQTVNKSNFENPKKRENDHSVSLKEMEKAAIIQALMQSDNCISEAIKILGISRTTLYRKLKEYDIAIINR